MTAHRIWSSATAAVAALSLASPMVSRAGESPGEVVESIGIAEHLGGRLPLDVELADAGGTMHRLGELIGERPVLLSLVYYRCPMLCGESLEGLLRATRAFSLELGQDFDLVTVSFDPDDGPEEAAAQKRRYRAKLGAGAIGSALRFLTGGEAAIDALTASVGFRYARGGAPGQFAHASTVVVVTPEGRISRYFHGIEYSARDLELALMEASTERIGSPAARILLYCYRYDPATGRYGLVVLNALRLAGVMTLALLGLFVGLSLYRERSRSLSREKER